MNVKEVVSDILSSSEPDMFTFKVTIFTKPMKDAPGARALPELANAIQNSKEIKTLFPTMDDVEVGEYQATSDRKKHEKQIKEYFKKHLENKQ